MNKSVSCISLYQVKHLALELQLKYWLKCSLWAKVVFICAQDFCCVLFSHCIVPHCSCAGVHLFSLAVRGTIDRNGQQLMSWVAETRHLRCTLHHFLAAHCQLPISTAQQRGRWNTWSLAHMYACACTCRLMQCICKCAHKHRDTMPA